MESDRLRAARALQEVQAIRLSLHLSLTSAWSVVEDSSAMGSSDRLTGSLTALMRMGDRVEDAVDLVIEGRLPECLAHA